MKTLFLAAALTAFALPVLAQDDPVLAIYREDSGTLPPKYAWSYEVKFHESGLVAVEYCKGYADQAPGCATGQQRLDQSDQDAMRAELAVFSAKLIEIPPQNAADDEIPIGGGSIDGWVLVNQTKVILPAFTAEKDAERVIAVLGILQKFTPQKLVEQAERQHQHAPPS
jgi:hypothetical protein